MNTGQTARSVTVPTCEDIPVEIIYTPGKNERPIDCLECSASLNFSQNQTSFLDQSPLSPQQGHIKIVENENEPESLINNQSIKIDEFNISDESEEDQQDERSMVSMYTIKNETQISYNKHVNNSPRFSYTEKDKIKIKDLKPKKATNRAEIASELFHRPNMRLRQEGDVLEEITLLSFRLSNRESTRFNSPNTRL